MLETKSQSNRGLEFLRGLNLPREDYAIFGSGPLMIRGIIESSEDLDVVCRGDAWDRVQSQGHLRYLDDFDVTIAEFLDGGLTFGTRWGIGDFCVDQLIDTAEIIEGLPFVRLRHVIDYKQIADRPKDREHLYAWRKYSAGE